MKFYIHHIYSYELFWYFFHGVDVNPKTIPTWFYKNRHNKHDIIDFNVSIEFVYKGINCTAIFSHDREWGNDDGTHLFDYTIDLMERDIIQNRGWNDIMNLKLNSSISFLNNKSKKLKNSKVKFFHINWESHSPSELNLFEKLNKNIEVYTDNPDFIHARSQKYSFTHFLASFLWPNSIGIREYYFIADYLKDINQYVCRINYPIRRITIEKLKLYEGIQKLNNKNIRCTFSSFTEYKQHEDSISPFKNKYKNLIKDNSNIDYIKKRGYNINDWGGEWNDSNMNEFMYKLLDYSNINIIAEKKTHISEKSISHILAGKPLIPQFFETVTFLETMFLRYNLKTNKYPFDYIEITQMLDILEEIVNDDGTFQYIINALQLWVDSLRDNFINVIHNNNDMLDDMIKKDEEFKSPL
jgi:hypothetical protein